jgi:signal transduction histidine kinase
MLRTIGHEMSQPIMLISGFFNRLRSDFEKMKKHNLVGFSREDLENHLDDLNEKEKAVKRIANVMEDLKKQAGIYKTEIKLVLINPIIKQTAKIENFDTKGKEFKILVNTDEIIDEIRIDEEQMHVILKNIIENSIDALPDKNGIIKVTSKLNKEHVLITIEDNGKGIPYKMHNRVIEPFITTKRKGTGLGLTIVRNFLKEINGSFDVFSEVNKGTTIKIKIPYK